MANKPSQLARNAPNSKGSSAGGRARAMAATHAWMAAAAHAGLPAERREYLREALPATAALLARRRADMIEDGVIDDYVALQWLEWHGGGLRLTITGTNVCAQVTQSLR
ncbi:hypothetical protein [Methylibium rhizosphaerae]|uniref:hypothetical protein n=1 Tax=Methylibium rhizosphaerae TaxID=2570323 RepID=UPI00319E8CA4